MLAIALGGCGENTAEQTEAVHLDRAKAYQAQGQFKAATIEYRNAMKKTQNSVEAALPFTDMLQELGYVNNAMDVLEVVPEAQRNEAYYIELVETYLGLDKFSSAEKTFAAHVKSDTVQARLLAAQIQSGLGNLDAASKMFSQVLSSDAGNAEAILGLSMIKLRSGQSAVFDEVLTQLKKIGADSDQYVKAQLLVSGIQIERGELEAAEATLTQLLAQLPNTDQMVADKAVVLERLSYVLTRQGRSNEAYIYTKLLSEAFPGSSEAGDKIKQAYERFQDNDLDAAKALLIDVLEEFPTHAKAKQTLGIIAYIQGDLDTASKYLSESVDPEVADPIATQIYAAAALRLNNPKKVLEILEGTIETTTSAPTLALYGISAIADKQKVKGENALKKAISLDPKNVRYRIALANFYRDEGGAASGQELTQLEQAYAIAPENRILLEELLSYHYRNGGQPAAQTFVNSQLANHPDSAATQLIAGYYQANHDNFEKAYVYFAEAAKRVVDGEDRLVVLSAKGKAEYRLKKFDQAEKTFNDLVRFYPQNELGYSGLYAAVMASTQSEETAVSRMQEMAKRNASTLPLEVLVRAALSDRDTTKARSYLEQIRELKPNDKQTYARVDSSIGYLELNEALRSRDLNKARMLISERLLGNPEDMRLLSTLVEIEIEDKKYREAEKVIQQMEGINTASPLVPMLKGQLEMARQNLAGAREFYEQAWALQPNDMAADRLYRVLIMQKDEAARAQHLERWLQALPDSPLALQSKAMYYQERGEQAEAMALYDRLLVLQPNNVIALNNQGWLYFESGKPQALELLKRAVELAPQNPAILDSYGWVLAKSGKVQAGIDYLEQAVKLAPEMKEISEHLDQAKAMK